MIWKRIDEHHIDEGSYARSTEYQDLLTMPMLRICELVSEYRSVFEEIDESYPWADVAKMRSKIAHPYDGFDFGFVWDAVTVDPPSSLMFAGRGFRNSEVACSKTLHV